MNRKWGVLSALIFICIGAFPQFYQYMFMTEPISNLFIVMLFYVLMFRKPSYYNLFLIGGLAAISCSIRQSCVFVFLPLAFEFPHYTERLDKKKALAYAFAGIGLIIIPMLLYLIVNSALWDAFYWCFYAFIRFGGSGLSDKIARFSFFLVLLLPFIIPIILTLKNLTRSKKIIWLWLLGSIITVQFGYSWIHNYLNAVPPIPLLAAIGILELYNLQNVEGRWRYIARGVLIFVVLDALMLVFTDADAMRVSDTNYYIGNQAGISKFIASHTSKDDGIFVFMTDCYVYYLSDRKPVTRMTFFWMGYLEYMNDSEKNEYIFEPLEMQKPKYFVMNPLMYENDSTVVKMRHYLDEKYDYVNSWGLLELYERKS
jgi:uncharacterized membrane protein